MTDLENSEEKAPASEEAKAKATDAETTDRKNGDWIRDKRQVAWVVIGVLLVGLFAYSQTPHTHPLPSANRGASSGAVTHFTSVLTHVDTQGYLNRKLVSDLHKVEGDQLKTVAVVEKELILGAGSKERMSAMQKEIDALRQAVVSRSVAKPPSEAQAFAQQPQAVKMQVTTVRHLSSESVQPQKTAETYVPRGSFVRAVLLGAADAAAGALSQTNPDLMLLKLTSEGILPNGGHSHLKGCFVTASVVGDVSSERGKIRLVGLSCLKPSGEIIDVDVQGMVFGDDGRNGVRGRVDRREGPLLWRAALAGAMGGLGDMARQMGTPLAGSLTTQIQYPSAGRVAQQAGGNAAGNALDKLAVYNIKRAEQYHPVIRLHAGQKVDVVFENGFWISGEGLRATKGTETPPVRSFGQGFVVPKLPAGDQ